MILAAIMIPNVTTFLQIVSFVVQRQGYCQPLGLAKMSAASGFTQAELNCTLTGNSCQLAVCTTKGATVCTTYTNQGGPILLSQGMSFGYGSITTPAGSQATISNTNPIVFNSRSIPIDSTGAPTGNDALYLTDSSGDTYALTFTSAAGSPFGGTPVVPGKVYEESAKSNSRSATERSHCAAKVE